MKCREISTLLPLFPGDDLPWWRRRQVGRHLARCARCRKELGELETSRALARAALQSVTGPTTLGDMCGGIMARLPREPMNVVAVPARARPAQVLRPGRHRRGLVFVGTFVTASLLGVVLLGPGTNRPDHTARNRPVSSTTGFDRPVVERIDGPGLKMLDLDTDSPHVTIAWVYEPASDPQEVR